MFSAKCLPLGSHVRWMIAKDERVHELVSAIGHFFSYFSGYVFSFLVSLWVICCGW